MNKLTGWLKKFIEFRKRRTGKWVVLDGNQLIERGRKRPASEVEITATFDIESTVQIKTYKLDRFTSDSVCLEFKDDADSVMWLCEEDPGWPAVVERLSKWDGIQEGWFDEVVHPPMATNEKVIYERPSTLSP